MDNLLDPTTGDYAGTQTQTLANAVYLRLMVPLGSWWANPKLGSKLHLLQREKDLSRVRVLARQYAEEALAPLVEDGRATSVTVTASQGNPGWLILLIEVVSASNDRQTFTLPVRVS
ncbi:phage GP46 family protein [Rahnella aquatilis]|uniref:phage GP46 family protein n=1 Tax=Rahnella aquatilis TaxID=34038 RepID=UPI00365D1A2E